jgi:hypothetical protein
MWMNKDIEPGFSALYMIAWQLQRLRISPHAVGPRVIIISYPASRDIRLRLARKLL